MHDVVRTRDGQWLLATNCKGIASESKRLVEAQRMLNLLWSHGLFVLHPNPTTLRLEQEADAIRTAWLRQRSNTQ